MARLTILRLSSSHTNLIQNRCKKFKKMKEFLSKSGLYQVHTLLEKFSSSNSYYSTPYDLKGETFDYYCENEDKNTTFELELETETEEFYGKMPGNILLNKNIIDNKLNYTLKTIGKCKSCNEYHMYFLLNVFSKSTILSSKIYLPKIQLNHIKIEESDKNIYIQKVGAYPEIKIIPNKQISKYFGRETNIWYFKGINSINENYGIGAFAYFRRIIEKELINIIEDIKSLPDSHNSEIENLLNKHKENPTMSTLYSNIFEYLPFSLKALGDNPIKLLYNQTSEGLHQATEEECLNKARNILKLLNFVIRKINEEKSEIKDLREVIKSLK